MYSTDLSSADADLKIVARLTNVAISSPVGPEQTDLWSRAMRSMAQTCRPMGPGFFIYFNSNLGLNRLVYSTDLSSATADLKIVNRLTDRVGTEAITALGLFTAADFELR